MRHGRKRPRDAPLHHQPMTFQCAPVLFRIGLLLECSCKAHCWYTKVFFHEKEECSIHKIPRWLSINTHMKVKQPNPTEILSVDAATPMEHLLNPQEGDSWKDLLGLCKLLAGIQMRHSTGMVKEMDGDRILIHTTAALIYLPFCLQPFLGSSSFSLFPALFCLHCHHTYLCWSGDDLLRDCGRICKHAADGTTKNQFYNQIPFHCCKCPCTC